MTETTNDWTNAHDAANLLLWLLIHGGDSLPEGPNEAIPVSAQAYGAALDFVTTLASEFADTRLADHAQVTTRMTERLNIEPIPTERLVYPPGTGPNFCFVYYGNAHANAQVCLTPPWLDPLTMVEA